MKGHELMWMIIVGYPAAVVEMLLQSHGVEGVWPLYLLPALPTAWSNGTVQGLGARGGFTVDISWSNGTFKSATILSTLGRELNLTVGHLPSSTTEFYIEGLDITSSNGNLKMQTQTGKSYLVLPK